MSELDIIKELGSNSALIVAIVLLWRQYTASINRMFEREREFYEKVTEILAEIQKEISKLNK